MYRGITDDSVQANHYSALDWNMFRLFAARMPHSLLYVVFLGISIEHHMCGGLYLAIGLFLGTKNVYELASTCSAPSWVFTAEPI